MKKFSYLILLTSFLIFLNGCNKNESDMTENEGVENFIELIRTGTYKSLNLPGFTHRAIPALLQYRNDRQVITDFPVNPISSYAMLECRLGMFVLWTIESIRAVSIDSPDLIMNFPSQNPILTLRHSEDLQMVEDDLSHNIAAKAYYDWWEKNKKKSFDRFNNIDPLNGTEYKWK